MITTKQKNSANIRIYFSATILALLLWSTSFVGTKIAYSTFGPITLGASRFVIASVVLGIVMLINKEFTKPTLKDLGLMSVSGILGITLYFTMENIGVNLTTASNAALIVASYPAITALLELIIYRIRISKTKVLGISIAMIGAYILTCVGSDNNVQGQYIGNILLFATGIVWAFYNFTTRKVVSRYSALTVSFFQTVSGTICFLPLTLIEKKSWQTPTFASLVTLIYLGIFCSVIAFMLYNFGLRRLSSSTAVSLMNIVPIFGVLFSMIFLHETVTLQQLIGGAIVIIGVLLSTRQIERKNISNFKEISNPQ